MTVAEATAEGEGFSVMQNNDTDYTSLYFNAFGDHSAGSVQFDFSPIYKNEPLVGVCTLLSDATDVSYYTCPDRTDADDLSGKFASCFLKFSESKGYKAKNVEKNERCMITKDMTTPVLKEFSFAKELSKVRGVF
jgi:hypothetical protein